MPEITKDSLWKKYQETMAGMYNESNKPWTLEYQSCEMVVGNIEDAHGREVQVKINISADQDDWEDME